MINFVFEFDLSFDSMTLLFACHCHKTLTLPISSFICDTFFLQIVTLFSSTQEKSFHGECRHPWECQRAYVFTFLLFLEFHFAFIVLYIPMDMIVLLFYCGIYRLPRSSVWICWKIWCMWRVPESTNLCHCPQRTWPWYASSLSYSFMLLPRNHQLLQNAMIYLYKHALVP